MKNFTRILLGMLVVMTIALFYHPQRSFAYTGEVIKSFHIPGVFPTGMTFDGKHIWLADRKDKMIYCIEPASGKVVRSIPTPGYWPTGLTWDGEYLWAADVKGGLPLSENYQGLIYKLDPENGNILHTVQSPSSTPRGLAWDGRYLWCSDNSSDMIIQFDADDGTTIKEFKSPSGDPRGLTFDGQYLWVSDRMRDEIYMVEPEKGTVLIIADAPGQFTLGLCFDGKYLWAVDTEKDRIFQLSVRDNDLFHRYNERNALVNYTHEITNFGPGNVLTADVYLALPKNRDSQVINKIQHTNDYTDVVADASGQECAHYHFDGMEPGEAREGSMVTDATIYEIRYFIYPDQVGSLEDIPQDIKDKFLKDDEKYQLDHPVIQDALKKCVGDEQNPYWIARNIYQHLIENMYYEMVGGWNTAPTVLDRGNGSCSEYTFVFISMCRAAGLPARYVGSVVVRGDDHSMDDVFHRWAEVYLPNYGWIPADPSGGDHHWPRDQANYFGHLDNRFLITTENAGGSEYMGWTYNSNAHYTTEPKTFVVTDHYADWKPKVK